MFVRCVGGLFVCLFAASVVCLFVCLLTASVVCVSDAPLTSGSLWPATSLRTTASDGAQCAALSGVRSEMPRPLLMCCLRRNTRVECEPASAAAPRSDHRMNFNRLRIGRHERTRFSCCLRVCAFICTFIAGRSTRPARRRTLRTSIAIQSAAWHTAWLQQPRAGLQHRTACCNPAQHAAAQQTMFQRSATCCNPAQHVAPWAGCMGVHCGGMRPTRIKVCSRA